MRFIKEKNLQKNEVLLYVPETHWMYVVTPLLKALVVLLVFPLLVFVDSRLFYPVVFIRIVLSLTKYAVFTIIAAGAIWFVWKLIVFLFIEYGITNKRLVMKRGVLRLMLKEIAIDRIESLTCVQGILGRLFNYGTIYVSGIGGTTPLFYMVRKPWFICRKIDEIIEKNKAITVIRGGFPKPKALPPRPPRPAPKESPYLYGTFVRVCAKKPVPPSSPSGGHGTPPPDKDQK
jgi:hypothetical protein